MKSQITTYEDIETARERLARFSKIDPETGCHIFQKQKTAGGYGIIGAGSVQYLAHRVSYLLAHPHETLSRSDLICHSCDTPACVNPEHLFKSDSRGNMQDSVAKGRLNTKRKHTDEQVIEIRKRWQQGDSIPTLCRDFRLDPRCLVDLVKGRNYKHLPLYERDPELAAKRGCGEHDAPKGEDHYKAKLTETDVRTIRLHYEQGTTKSQLARQFGVDPRNIYFIVNKLTWKHVEDTEPLALAAD